ncbi:GNAT family N-acetyltransferase [filamentous cyanobacterium CCP5]|nr:GNAT family N-acetyltransferase [filamentous cyanobacterium CCP5]
MVYPHQTDQGNDSVRLRPTQLADLDYVLKAENAPENAVYIRQWSRDRHQEVIDDADEAHFILDAGGQPVGYVILQDLLNPDQSVMLRRLVITEKGKGYGQQALALIFQQVFERHGAHRLWLDVKRDNDRAKYLYSKVGFVYEGCLRESLKTATGFDSMEIMSILQREYRQRQQP